MPESGPDAPARPIRVLIADDHEAMRVGIRTILEEAGFEICAEARDADGAVDAALRERPDVCLLDVRMPGGGIAAAAEIARSDPDTAVVMLSVSTNEQDALRALRAGASGYLLKEMDSTRLPAAIRGVLQGEAALPRRLTAHLIEDYRDRDDRHRLPRLRAAREPLRPREREVLALLVERLDTRQISQELGISPVTVRRHLSEVLRKLGVADREEAIRLVEEARRQP